MTTHTFDLQEFNIWNEDGEPKEVSVEIDLEQDEPADPGTPPSLNYPGDPPWPATYVISEIRLIATECGTLIGNVITTMIITEENFITFFAGADDVINNAFEWAAEQEED